jgi:hypothetical protein
MLGVFAEFETNLQRERQLEGIAKAKVAGVYNGRKPSIDVAKIEALKASGLGPTEIVRKLKIGRASVYRVVARRTPKGKPRRLGRTGFSHYRTAGDGGLGGRPSPLVARHPDQVQSGSRSAAFLRRLVASDPLFRPLPKFSAQNFSIGVGNMGIIGVKNESCLNCAMANREAGRARQTVMRRGKEVTA